MFEQLNFWIRKIIGNLIIRNDFCSLCYLIVFRNLSKELFHCVDGSNNTYKFIFLAIKLMPVLSSFNITLLSLLLIMINISNSSLVDKVIPKNVWVYWWQGV